MNNIFMRSMLFAVAFLLTSGAAFAAGSKDLNNAMILWRGETKAGQGFKDGLKELSYTARAGNQQNHQPTIKG